MLDCHFIFYFFDARNHSVDVGMILQAACVQIFIDKFRRNIQIGLCDHKLRLRDVRQLCQDFSDALRKPDNEAAQRALACGDVRALGAALGNVLEPVSRRMRPEIDRAICAIEENGAVGARMTGSGSQL